MFWGTEITRMACSWQQYVTLFAEELPWLKGRDLDLVRLSCGGKGEAATAPTGYQPSLCRGRNLSAYAFVSWNPNCDVVH
jgi:hypothetical protein